MTTVEESLPHLGVYVKLWYKKYCQASVSKVPQNVGTVGVFKHLSLGPGDLTTQSSICRCSSSCKRPSWRKEQLLSTATWSPNHSCFPCICHPNPSPFVSGKEPVRNLRCFRSGTLPFFANKPCFKSIGWHWMCREMLDEKYQQNSSSILWKLVTAISSVRIRMVVIYSQLQIISSSTLLNLSLR